MGKVIHLGKAQSWAQNELLKGKKCRARMQIHPQRWDFLTSGTEECNMTSRLDAQTLKAETYWVCVCVCVCFTVSLVSVQNPLLCYSPAQSLLSESPPPQDRPCLLPCYALIWLEPLRTLCSTLEGVINPCTLSRRFLMFGARLRLRTTECYQ